MTPDPTRPEAVCIQKYLDADGRVTRWPKSKVNRKDRIPILAYFAAHFDECQSYAESEVNEILKSLQTFGDHALMRRELVDHKLLHRESDGSRYWKPESF